MEIDKINNSINYNNHNITFVGKTSRISRSEKVHHRDPLLGSLSKLT